MKGVTGCANKYAHSFSYKNISQEADFTSFHRIPKPLLACKFLENSMETISLPKSFTTHVVAIPYPHRSHTNCMMNLCKSIASRRPNQVLITVIVTHEWLGYIGSEPKPCNIRFASIPDVIPPEHEKAADVSAFFEAAMRNMQAPSEKLLDQLEPPVSAIIGDVELGWPTAVANRKNIPVAVLWTMSARCYNITHRLGVLARNRSLDVDLFDADEQGLSTYIPGISSAELAELRKFFHDNDLKFMQLSVECLSQVPKANYLLLNTIQELEPEPIDFLKTINTFPVYLIGPSIPYLEENHSAINGGQGADYLNWLHSQPPRSVLYIALGSFLSLSKAQMDEIAEALNNSGIFYFWVARDEYSWLKEKCGEKGLVVPWCDQFNVLNHSSIGGFWSHCGWNSVMEAVFCGVPILTFPLWLDQVPNSKQVLEEWKNGWEMKRSEGGGDVGVKKQDIEEIVRRFMDLESKESKEMRDKAREVQGILRQAINKGGSSDANLDAFIRKILREEN